RVHQQRGGARRAEQGERVPPVELAHAVTSRAVDNLVSADSGTADSGRASLGADLVRFRTTPG
ncbi:hypothetical protein, partial [Amycolatopsis sp. SID8362]|uniref:hypothetical protein n=1 Tax=Amycolatopsis sp. SID8362 TaxID=2690346 RepID=UPI00194215C6